MSLRSAGFYMNSECNKLPYNRTVGIKYLECFERDELELIFWRSGLTIFNINATICHHHEQTVLKKLSSMQKTCFNLFKAHKKAVEGLFN